MKKGKNLSLFLSCLPQWLFVSVFLLKVSVSVSPFPASVCIPIYLPPVFLSGCLFLFFFLKSLSLPFPLLSVYPSIFLLSSSVGCLFLFFFLKSLSLSLLPCFCLYTHLSSPTLCVSLSISAIHADFSKSQYLTVTKNEILWVECKSHLLYVCMMVGRGAHIAATSPDFLEKIMNFSPLSRYA